MQLRVYSTCNSAVVISFPPCLVYLELPIFTFNCLSDFSFEDHTSSFT